MNAHSRSTARRTAVVALALTVLAPAAPGWAEVQPLWVQVAESPGQLGSSAAAVAVDPVTGAVHVAGWPVSATTNVDIGLVTYSAAGEQLQVRRFDAQGPGAQHPIDALAGMVLDSDTDTVYIASSFIGAAGAVVVTLAYGRTGPPIWTAEYPLPGIFTYETTQAITRDPVSGNLYVLVADAFDWQGQLILAYSPDGKLLWEAPLGIDENITPRALAVDTTTGVLYATGDGKSLDPAADYVYTSAYAASGRLLWAKKIGGSAVEAIAVNETTHTVYVVGRGPGDRTISSDPTNWLVAAYDSAGTELWSRAYGGTDDDGAVDVAVNQQTGEIYVTGNWGQLRDVYLNNYATIAYSATGQQLWVDQYTGARWNSYDTAAALAFDPDRGLLYVTGSSTSPDFRRRSDLVTIAYRTTGERVRVDRYATGHNGESFPTDIVVNPRTGAVVLTGHTSSSERQLTVAVTLAYPAAS